MNFFLCTFFSSFFFFKLMVFFVFRESPGEKADHFDSQVVQYEPAHQGSINTVTNLSPELCVSGGTDQVIKSLH